MFITDNQFLRLQEAVSFNKDALEILLEVQSQKRKMPESCEKCPIQPICIAECGKGNCPTVWKKL